ncbi:NAD(P)/FAD-dependent oxidoreductase [Lichenifustis flavocetrariae]|uniref:FAD-binding oxidoreductase n=1 Tax=Lichenifustis flavocetrariae TaxID=2949735 RepID=A0AA42CKE9_9HYPH|nr:FAD-binding oxidoreductase [Lichenifustis flavocetrariae]MCW6509181.1 FAD-binding oxidoreductase [Lichenifustis flavocetrariae]
MKNDPRSHGLWERTAAPAPLTPALAEHIKVDVLVVGAGFTGLSAALHLAEAGSRVAVLEGEEIGFGGSGRNVGLVNAGMWVMPDDLPGELGPIYGDRLLDLLGNAPKLVFELVARHAIDCEIMPVGTLHCAVGTKGLKEIEERATQWQRRGAPVELLDARAAASLIGTSAYAGALLDRRAGTIQPLAYVRGLARAAMAAGARLYSGSPVESVVRDGQGWMAKTPRGAVSAPWIVVATNAYTRTPWPAVRAELVHLPYFNFATEPLTDNVRRSILPEQQGAWDTEEVLSSFRFDAAGRLVFGSVGALRGTGLSVHKFWARRMLRRLFPQLGEIRFESEWYGHIGMTANNLPRFHRFAPGVVGFSGYNGRGIAPGTVFGRELARLVLGQITEADLPLPVTDPRAEPFRFIKETVYEVGAQAAHLKAALF